MISWKFTKSIFMTVLKSWARSGSANWIDLLATCRLTNWIHLFGPIYSYACVRCSLYVSLVTNTLLAISNVFSYNLSFLWAEVTTKKSPVKEPMLHSYNCHSSQYLNFRGGFLLGLLGLITSLYHVLKPNVCIYFTAWARLMMHRTDKMNKLIRFLLLWVF